MAERKMKPARPLFGYRDVGPDDGRHGRIRMRRSWILLMIFVTLYLGWTLTVYFLEPGLR